MCKGIMSNIRKKIIRDIYKGSITNAISFFENYIITNDPLPDKIESSYLDHSTQTETRCYMIDSKIESERLIKEFVDIYKTLSNNNLISSNQYKVPFNIRLFFKSEIEVDKYHDYQPLFVHSKLQTLSIIPIENRLKKYLSRGCRTEDEYRAYCKILLDKILFKYIPWVAILLTLGITVYATFFQKS